MTSISPTSQMPLQAQQSVDRNQERLRQAADGFESLFLNQMLKSSRETSFGNELFSSSATETTQSLLDQTLADQSSGRAGLGLSEAVYRQFSSHLSK